MFDSEETHCPKTMESIVQKLELWCFHSFSKLRQKLPYVRLEASTSQEVEIGMDSSRSGLFSTLIMTIPLIVVPAIALLRPAIQTSGISTNPLSASDDEDGDLFSEFDFDDVSREGLTNRRPPGQKSPDRSESSDYSEWFSEEVDSDSDSRNELTRPQPQPQPQPQPLHRNSLESRSDPFSPDANPTPPISRQSPEPERNQPERNQPEPMRSPADSPSESVLLEQVIGLGATRTMWFSTGNSEQFGFVAFVAGTTDQIRYRFESIGNSRSAAIRQVYEQIVKWRSTLPATEH